MDDDVLVSLGAELDSSGPLLDSLLGDGNSDLLFSDLELSLSSVDLSCLDLPSSDLTGSATAFLWNLVNGDGDDLSGLGASSDSVSEDDLSLLHLNNSGVDSDLSVDGLDSLASA